MSMGIQLNRDIHVLPWQIFSNLINVSATVCWQGLLFEFTERTVKNLGPLCRSHRCRRSRIENRRTRRCRCPRSPLRSPWNLRFGVSDTSSVRRGAPRQLHWMTMLILCFPLQTPDNSPPPGIPNCHIHQGRNFWRQQQHRNDGVVHRSANVLQGSFFDSSHNPSTSGFYSERFRHYGRHYGWPAVSKWEPVSKHVAFEALEALFFTIRSSPNVREFSVNENWQLKTTDYPC